jgi:hypothetical protein
MKKKVTSIVWPQSDHESLLQIRRYMVRVVKAYGITFPASQFEPDTTVARIVAGEATDSDRSAAITHWWGVVDEIGISNFSSETVLAARVAICLLSPSEENVSSFTEQLLWFFEVIGFLGKDVETAEHLMEEFFSFS